MRTKRKLIYGILVALSLVAIVLAIVLSFNQKMLGLKVVFLNVGQGDAILVSQGNTQLLIDGGRDGKTLLAGLGKYVPFWDRTIEMVMVTHPDQDHIGGLISVLSAYQVGAVFETKMRSESQTYKRIEGEIEKNKVEKIEAKKNVSIKFSNGAVVEILYPFETVTNINNKDTNSYSVLAKLTIGDNKFLFTGDLTSKQESQLLAKNMDIDADFLKVAHHGSKYATSDEFLEKVTPSNAIISVGKNNSYGHPSPEVLQRLTQHGVKIFRTDESGDIVYNCQSLSGNCEIVR